LLKKGIKSTDQKHKLKTYQVCWGDHCIGEIQATSKRLVRKHLFDLFRERIAEALPYLIFQDPWNIRVKKVAEDGDAEEKDAK
jgi:hypothetical protein